MDRGGDKRGETMKAIDAALSEIREMQGVKGVMLASTSGSHIAGEPPSSAHLETFTTMSAILLGAAQTATKELRDSLKYVDVKLESSRLLVLPAGEDMLLVIEAEDGSDIDEIVSRSVVTGRKISEMF